MVSSNALLENTSDVYLEVTGFDGLNHDVIDASGRVLTLAGDLTVDLRNLLESDVSSGDKVQLVLADSLNANFDKINVLGLETHTAIFSIENDINGSLTDVLLLEIA